MEVSSILSAPITTGPYDGYDTCYSAGLGADYSEDISATGGTNVRLYLDYAGWSGTQATLPPDNDEPITIDAKVASQYYWSGASGDNDCQYTELEIRVSYIDVFGSYHGALTIGSLYFGHVDRDSYEHSVNDVITYTHSKSNPYGSGTVYYVSGVKLAEVFADPDNTSGCAFGSHLHFEADTYHGKGGWAEQESDAGPDFFKHAYQHVHCDVGCPTEFPAGPHDDATLGATIGYLGGGTITEWVY